MKNLFSIGELSKLQNISRQTLIFYDKIGLFRAFQLGLAFPHLFLLPSTLKIAFQAGSIVPTVPEGVSNLPG